MVKETKRFNEEYDVVVIGAGIGGLTCAAYLAKNGRKVKPNPAARMYFMKFISTCGKTAVGGKTTRRIICIVLKLSSDFVTFNRP